jgi:hypothetical protein
MLWPDLIDTSWHATLSAQTAREPGQTHYFLESLSISTKQFADRTATIIGGTGGCPLGCFRASAS